MQRWAWRAAVHPQPGHRGRFASRRPAPVPLIFSPRGGHTRIFFRAQVRESRLPALIRTTIVPPGVRGLRD
jgi:hypothetical protein